ncbi:MAG TPA: hypothetical protein DIW24_06230, partial [Bacteroidetes bacterium]|nr:hypothetical protein [Bacteroidota bacterium]
MISFENRIARQKRLQNRWLAGHRRLSRWRIGVFLGTVALAYGLWSYGYVAAGGSAGLSGAMVFGVLARRHKKVEAAIRRSRTHIALLEDRLARVRLDWKNIPITNPLPVAADHPFAHDLNLIGPRSLLTLLNTTTTPKSIEWLQNHLLTEVPVLEQTQRNQRWIKDLAIRSRFCERLRLVGTLALHSQTEPLPASEKILQPATDLPKLWQGLLPMLGLAALNLVLFVFFPAFWVGGIFIYWFIYILHFQKLKNTFDAALDVERYVHRISDPFLFLETVRIPTQAPLLEILDIFRSTESRPSSHLKTLRHIATAISYTRNEFLFVLLNTLVPWQYICTWLLEREKVKLGTMLHRWIEAHAQVEGLAALANFAQDHLEVVFPKIHPEKPVLDAQELGHPLIPLQNRITNSFTHAHPQEIGLITGSNMSGKSTFLRTVGINLVLAYAGTAVNARQMHIGGFRLFTCLNVSDSVNDGISYFYAEVKRLKLLLDAAKQAEKKPLFYL